MRIKADALGALRIWLILLRGAYSTGSVFVMPEHFIDAQLTSFLV